MQVRIPRLPFFLWFFFLCAFQFCDNPGNIESGSPDQRPAANMVSAPWSFSFAAA
jgi:hypothetical protein